MNGLGLSGRYPVYAFIALGRSPSTVERLGTGGGLPGLGDRGGSGGEFSPPLKPSVDSGDA